MGIPQINEKWCPEQLSQLDHNCQSTNLQTETAKQIYSS